MPRFDNHEIVLQQTGILNVSGSVNNTFYLDNSTIEDRSTNVNEPGLTRHDEDVLASLAFPQMLDRKDNIEEPHAGTCQWILDSPQFNDWMGQDRGLLWIKGNPGTGKSTLMSYLFAAMESNVTASNTIRLEFFFSGRGSELQRTPTGMLRSLLNQLFRQDLSVRLIISAAYQKKAEAFGRLRGGWQWQKPELEKLLSETVFASLRSRSVMLFIDALDEAGSRAARETATYFHQLNDQAVHESLPLKTCIACRHYPVSAINGGSEITMEQNNLADVSRYIIDHSVVHLGRYGSAHDRAGQELVAELIAKAQGNFQWASLVTPMIESYLIDGESLDRIRDRLTEVPMELSNVYEHILLNVIDKSYRARSFVLFQWACLAEEPLSVGAMRYALAAPDACSSDLGLRFHRTSGFIKDLNRMQLQVKSLSGGLLECTKEGDTGNSSAHVLLKSHSDQVVQVIHHSVKEFMLTDGLLALSRSAVPNQLSLYKLSFPRTMSNTIGYCHLLLHLYCLRYLNTEISTGKPYGFNHFPRDDLRPSFGDYAVVNLFSHARQMDLTLLTDFERYLQDMEQIMPLWPAAFRSRSATWTHMADGSDSVLHAAIEFRARALAKELILRNYKTSYCDSRGRTAMHIAAISGDVELAKLLKTIDGQLVSTQDLDGATPLLHSIESRQMEFFTWMIQAGANPHATTDYDGTMLITAVINLQYYAIQMLIDAGVDLNAHGGQHGTALMAAVNLDDSGIVRTLLHAGAQVNTKPALANASDIESWYPLHTAARAGNLEIVKLLLNAGARVDAPSDHLGTALHMACLHGYKQIVALLLKHGASTGTLLEPYGTPLHAAVASNVPEVVNLLLEASAQVNSLTDHHGTALHLACERHSLEIAKLLLKYGASTTVLGGKWRSPLHAAVASNVPEVVTALLEGGAHVDYVVEQHGTALHLACNLGNLEIVKLLLRHGASVDIQIEPFGTPLQVAARHGRREILEILIAGGIDV